MNPQDTDEQQSRMSNFVTVETGRVKTVPTHTAGDSIAHAVEVETSTSEEPEIAEVSPDTLGDVALPTEGDDVIIGTKLNGDRQVLGVRYSKDDTIPPFEEGVRVVGHPTSDSRVRFEKDGTVVVHGQGGSKVELATDGSVTVNEGSTAPVTDVDFANETVTRASNVYVPSN